ncbi:MAG TPA: hypothetical protein VNQ78_13225 [Paracoccus sp. (in: a-proteobacteria)]|uniref:hypothetical protein n=1 Tax=Paracoccus sp. TaxID=267 RepID=UPI002C3B0E07|nr:hypothetical protein [Paracoccus sp. (in: a-proteobacteria)]HWL57616.1 hypothetical protein [Paracoccus sp. (in: a-proteobacteria)]
MKNAILRLGLGIAAGFLLKSALDARRTPTPRLGNVRDAGPEAMKNPPRDWDAVDEQADESFPASDPPANY